jgi:pimeloyl-ACP methyl ester carboxylesterase
VIPATRARYAALAALAALLLTACETPIGIRAVSSRRAYELQTRSALVADEPSDYTLNLLRRRELLLTFREDPIVAIDKLHDAARAEHFPSPMLFALSELSFLVGERTGDRARYAASTIYAWAFLFPEDGRAPIRLLDARERLAADLYNRALVLSFARTEAGTVDLQAAPLGKLPFGTLAVERDPKDLVINGYQLYDLLPVSELEIRGLANRYRRSGIGAAFAAKARPLPDVVEVVPLGAAVRVPITAVVVFPKPIAQLESGNVHGKVDVVQTLETRAIPLEGRIVPVESENSAALAAGLRDSAFWKQELSTFFGSATGVRAKGGLAGLRPYKRGRIPAVFVHGTASSPARWANMVNDLLADPEYADRYAFWFFFYDSGNPIAYSGSRLRAALTGAVERADPSGSDPCVRDMIVLGHSQGGLLTKLTVVDSGNVFWANVSSKPFADMKLPEKDRLLLQDSLFLKPLPFVRTVIFLATPQQGSYLAGPQFVRRLVFKLVSMPGDLLRISGEIAKLTAQGGDSIRTLQLPTSIDNMSPNNPFIKALAKLPVAPGVDAHSIISVEDPNVPRETAGDGVVKYVSAHVEGLQSELIVTSPHSGMQDAPATIEEVRRILYEHSARSKCPVPEVAD